MIDSMLVALNPAAPTWLFLEIFFYTRYLICQYHFRMIILLKSHDVNSSFAEFL